MSIFKSETFSDEPFVQQDIRPQRSIFVVIQEFNALINDAIVDRERIKGLVTELDDAHDNIVNQSFIEEADQEKLEGDVLSIRNTLKNPKLKEIGIGSRVMMQGAE